MKLLLFVLIMLIAQFARAQVFHDVSADSVVTVDKSPIASSISETVWITNRGTAFEQQFGVSCTIWDKFGNVVYRDTSFISQLGPSQSLAVRFADFTPLLNGPFQVCGTIILLPADHNPINDRSCRNFFTAYERDIHMLSIETPKLNDSIIYGTGFRPKVRLNNVGVEDLFEIPIRYELRRVSDGALVLRLDTIADAAFADSSVTTAVFQSVEGLYDTKRIPAGRYRAAAIARQPGDGDLTNDTAYSFLTIYKDHDLSADTMLSMPVSSILHTPIPIRARFSNHGLDEKNVRVRVTVTWNDSVQYCDTSTIAFLASGGTADVAFQYFTAAHVGSYNFCAEALLANDCDALNNSYCASFTEKVEHDLAVSSFVNIRQRIATKDTTNVTLRIKNVGWNDEQNGIATLVIRDSNASLVYKKSITVSECAFNDSVDVVFAGFAPLTQGRYDLIADITHPNDEVMGNDTIYTSVTSIANNVEVIAVDVPQNGDTLPLGQSFAPAARFWNTGATEIASVPVHLDIRRASDDSLLVRYTHSLSLLGDSIVASVDFESLYGGFNTAAMPAGDYVAAAFSDISSPPDTAYARFTIAAVPPPPAARVDMNAGSMFKARIYPNPCNAFANVNVSSALGGTVHVVLLDLLGRTLQSEELTNAGTIAINTEGLRAGAYQLRVNSPDGSVQLPLVVLH